MTSPGKIFTRLLITLVIVFGFTSLILVLSGISPLTTFYHLINGAFESWMKVARVVKVWIPLTLCSCGLVYTFRVGLWNIGVEGQIIMGAIFATSVLRLGLDSLSPALFISMAVLAAFSGGALWAIGAAFLKIKGGVHEIFAGLGLNFVAQGLTLWLIFGPWKRPGIASMSGTEIFPKSLWLRDIEHIHLSPVGLLFVVATFAVSVFILKRTRLGLGLKAIEKNRNAAFLLGLNPDKYIFTAMAVAGGLAGLAGCLQVTGVYHRLIPSISSNYGYLALLVVMLSNYNIWMVPFIAFFFACLNVGSIQLPMMLQIDSSLSGVIQGTFVLAVLFVQGWRLQMNYKGLGKKST